MKSGYIYVLVHPSDPDLYKIGITTRKPERRLTEHNSRLDQLPGHIVKETGQKWELKEYHVVPDPYWSEAVFWNATCWSDIPYQQRYEVLKTDWEFVKKGLDAAKKAGVRPPPGPLPDYAYANAAWMNRRLEGRDITLLEPFRMKHGKADFRCSNGHEWRTVPNDVAEGEGCPECGIGEKNPEEIMQSIEAGYLCLLTHPNKPGAIKIVFTYSPLEQCFEDNFWDGWILHRYRSIEDPILAESLIWEILDHPMPAHLEPVNIDLSKAEDAFRELISRMQSVIALAERKKEVDQKTD